MLAPRTILILSIGGWLLGTGWKQGLPDPGASARPMAGTDVFSSAPAPDASPAWQRARDAYATHRRHGRLGAAADSLEDLAARARHADDEEALAWVRAERASLREARGNPAEDLEDEATLRENMLRVARAERDPGSEADRPYWIVDARLRLAANLWNLGRKEIAARELERAREVAFAVDLAPETTRFWEAHAPAEDVFGFRVDHEPVPAVAEAAGELVRWLERSPDPEPRLRAARVLFRLGEVHLRAGHPREAEAAYLASRRRLCGLRADPDAQEELAASAPGTLENLMATTWTRIGEVSRGEVTPAFDVHAARLGRPLFPEYGPCPGEGEVPPLP